MQLIIFYNYFSFFEWFLRLLWKKLLLFQLKSKITQGLWIYQQNDSKRWKIRIQRTTEHHRKLPLTSKEKPFAGSSRVFPHRENANGYPRFWISKCEHLHLYESRRQSRTCIVLSIVTWVAQPSGCAYDKQSDCISLSPPTCWLILEISIYPRTCSTRTVGTPWEAEYTNYAEVHPLISLIRST